MDTIKNRKPSKPSTFVPAKPPIGVPIDMPGITHVDIVRGVAEGAYIRGIMVESQDPVERAPHNAVYELTTWQLGYSVFHVAHLRRPRLFGDLDQLVEMLRFEFKFRGPISLWLAGQKVA